MPRALDQQKLNQLQQCWDFCMTVADTANELHLSYSTVSKYFGIWRGHSMSEEERADRIAEGHRER